MTRTLLRRAWLGLAAAAVGCGGPGLAPVTGTVKLNGKPLANVQVEFWPTDASPRSTGATDDAGQYTLTTDGTAKPGAVVGKHKVVLHDLNVYAAVGIRPKEDTNIREIPARFPNRYNDPHKSPVTVTVAAGANDIEIVVDPR
jgi:hypothetical protein